MEVQRLEASTRTVSDAAVAVGCQEAEIAKSIVFIADGDPVVCVASGRHRIDPEKLADALDVAEVRQATARGGARRHGLRHRRGAAVRSRPAGDPRRGAAASTSASGPPRAIRTASSRSTRASWRAAPAPAWPPSARTPSSGTGRRLHRSGRPPPSPCSCSCRPPAAPSRAAAPIVPTHADPARLRSALRLFRPATPWPPRATTWLTGRARCRSR